MDDLQGRRRRMEMDAAIDRLDEVLNADYATLQMTLAEFLLLTKRAADRLEELGDDEVVPTLRDTLDETLGITPEGNHGRDDA